MSEQSQPRQEGIISRGFSTVVFWWLTTMGTVTLALSATVPMWIEYRQVVQVREQLQQQTEQLQKRVDRNNRYIKAYTEDPEALDLLAIADLRYRRPDEAPMPVPLQVVSEVQPVGWEAGASATDVPAKPGEKAQATADLNRVAQFVERGKAVSRQYLGQARSIALVDMFCDPTCRKALTAGALAVLAAALFLCKSNPVGRQGQVRR